MLVGIWSIYPSHSQPPFFWRWKATPLSFSCHHEDRLTWHYSPNGEFKLKGAYQLAINKDDICSRYSVPRAWVWKILSLPKVKHFLWKCCHHSIAVKAILNARGLGIPPDCLACNTKPKTIIHALRDCPKAECFWNSLLPPISPNISFGMPLVEWLKINSRSSRISAILRWSGVQFFLWLCGSFGCTEVELFLVIQGCNEVFWMKLWQKQLR